MSEALAPYRIALAVGAIGDRCGYVLLAERGARRKVFGPHYVEDGQNLAADVWVATYDGVTRACRVHLAVAAAREVLVVLLPAVQVLTRVGAAGDGRPHVATAARALVETASTVKWVRKHEDALMRDAHEELAAVGARALREGVEP